MAQQSAASAKSHQSMPARPLRWLLIVLGAISFGVGIIGIFVPGLPTTVFLLVAAWLWVRSHPPLERWLRNHPRFGPLLRAVGDGRSMTRRVKITALISLWVAVTISCLVVGGHSAAFGIRTGILTAAFIGSGVILFWVQTRAELQRTPVRTSDPS